MIKLFVQSGVHYLQTRKGRTQVDEKGFVKPETDHPPKRDLTQSHRGLIKESDESMRKD